MSAINVPQGYAAASIGTFIFTVSSAQDGLILENLTGEMATISKALSAAPTTFTVQTLPFTCAAGDKIKITKTTVDLTEIEGKVPITVPTSGIVPTFPADEGKKVLARAIGTGGYALEFGPEWRGIWTSGAVFRVDDLTSSAGVFYRAKLAHTNQTPPNTTYWDVYAGGSSLPTASAVGQVLTISTLGPQVAAWVAPATVSASASVMADYNVGTTYIVNQIVIDATTLKQYRSTVSSNTGNALSGSSWQNISQDGIQAKTVDNATHGPIKTLELPNGTLAIVGTVGTYTPASSGSSLTVEELSGASTGVVTKIKFPNGTLTNASGIATYTPASSGGSLTVEELSGASTGVATKIKFPNGTLTNASGVFTYTPSSVTTVIQSEFTLGYGGTPTASQVDFLPMVRAGTIATTGHVAISDIAATASATYNIRKNGTIVGTAVWAASATTGTATLSAATTHTSGDKYTLTAPASPDAAHSNIRVTFLVTN